MAEGKFFWMRCLMNGLALSVRDDDVRKGAHIVSWPYESLDSQQWYADDVHHVIRSKADDSLVLEAQGDRVVLNKFNPEETNQMWIIDGKKLRHRYNARRIIEIGGMVLNPNARIMAMDYYSGDNQHWDTEHIAPAFCFIRSMNDLDKVLDVAEDDDDEGAKVITYDKKEKDNDNQIWYEDKDGLIHSAMNDLVLDTSRKDTCQMAPYDSSCPGQQWVKSGHFIINRQMPDHCLEAKYKLLGHDPVEATKFDYDKPELRQHWTFDYIRIAES